jgi:hypothetical protein
MRGDSFLAQGGMITFFTTAKSFSGTARLPQYNAIGSWKQVHPDVEILLFGQGEGYADAVRDFGLIHIPDVETNEKGCPRIDSMFALAERHARHDIKAYLNCDIIVLPDVLAAQQRVTFDRHLMIGERWGLSVQAPVDFSVGWEKRVGEQLKAIGTPGRITAIDIFIYKGDIWREVPPMVIGRAGFDNYLVYYCRERGIPVVDMTGQATVIHQEHDYGHLAKGRVEVFNGLEAQRNVQLAGGWDYLFTIEDADWRLTDTGVARNFARNDSKRWAETCQVVARRKPLRRYLPRLLWECIAEAGIRMQQPPRVRMRQLLKLPFWLIRRFVVYACFRGSAANSQGMVADK